MADASDSYEIGYGKPPKGVRFVKGQSGNPAGRPKGSQNLAAILRKVGRERVKVTGNGRTRYMSKLEASATQLTNQAASGELRAIRELFQLYILCATPEQTALPPSGPHEMDEPVIANILKRMRQLGDNPSMNDPAPRDPSKEGE